MTNETNAERLSRILQDIQDGWSEASRWTFDTEDMKFLADRVQELEKSIKGFAAAVEIYSEMPVDEAMKQLVDIVQEDSQ